MRKNITIFIIAMVSMNIYAQNSYEVIADPGKTVFTTNDKPYYDENEYIIREFISQNSEFKIYYAGYRHFGKGEYYFFDKNERQLIIETYQDHGPAIKWHGKYIFEICSYSGEDDNYSYYYNFNTKKLSKVYSDVLYTDVANERIIVRTGGWELGVFDLNTDNLIKEYLFTDENYTGWPLHFLDHKIVIENNKLIFTFSNIMGEFITIIYDY